MLVLWGALSFKSSILALLGCGVSERRLRSSSSIGPLEIRVFLWLAGVCLVLWDICGERNDSVFWG